MTFVSALARTYSGSWRFLLALPMIAVALVAVEGLQHVVEWRSGFYISFAAMGASAADPERMIAGMLKVLWILVVGYWTARFLVSGSAKATLAVDLVAARKYGAVMALSVVVVGVMLFGPGLIPASDRHAASLALLAFTVVTMPIGVALVPWMVSSALGDADASIAMGFRRAKGSVLWGLALTILAPLPLMVAHYALGYGAVGRAPWLTVSMLAVDALLTAYLGVVISMASAVLSERMAKRAGVELKLGGP